MVAQSHYSSPASVGPPDISPLLLLKTARRAKCASRQPRRTASLSAGSANRRSASAQDCALGPGLGIPARQRHAVTYFSEVPRVVRDTARYVEVDRLGRAPEQPPKTKALALGSVDILKTRVPFGIERPGLIQQGSLSRFSVNPSTSLRTVTGTWPTESMSAWAAATATGAVQSAGTSSTTRTYFCTSPEVIRLALLMAWIPPLTGMADCCGSIHGSGVVKIPKGPASHGSYS